MAWNLTTREERIDYIAHIYHPFRPDHWKAMVELFEIPQDEVREAIALHDKREEEHRAKVAWHGSPEYGAWPVESVK